MARVGIVTDSTACVPPELASELAMQVIPLQLAFDDEVYQDRLSPDASAFYAKLRTTRRPPATAAPPPGVYADTMLRAAESARTVLCLTVSRQFSAMHDAAVQGAELARERRPGLDVRVLDSGAAAMAQGFVAIEAARAARQGAGIEQVLDRARELMPRVQLLVCLDTLSYLARSGRVPRLIVWASSPLQVKPLVEFVGGKYRPVGIVRSKAKAVDRLLQLLERRSGGGALHVCVQHTNVPSEAADLAERVRQTLRPTELYVQEFTQVMGVHTGPGLLGFSFYTEAGS